MLTSRGQENLVHARPAAGKALQTKTPNNLQTPRTVNRAPLGAKTTNAKAQTILKDKNNGKLQVFKTPAPNNNKLKPVPTINQQSTTRRSARSKITIAATEPAPAEALNQHVSDDEPDFGYAPPPITELPDDPPVAFPYDQTFPQFQPENMFRGYGRIYDASPKDENGFSVRLKKEEEEYRAYQAQQERELTQRARLELSQPLKLQLLDDFDLEIENTTSRIHESNPDTVRSKSAATALSGTTTATAACRNATRLPSAALKQTASSKLKITNKPKSAILKSQSTSSSTTSRPLSVSKNTIGFPKARKPPSIVPQVPEHRGDLSDDDEADDTATLADDLSDFEFLPVDDNEGGDGDGVFQLPVP